MRSLRQDSGPEIQVQEGRGAEGRGWGGFSLMCRLFMGSVDSFVVCAFPTAWGCGWWGSKRGGRRWRVFYKAEEEAWLCFSQVGFTRGESRDTLLCSHPLSPPLPKTAQECKGSFEASQRSSTLQETCAGKKRCFCAEISGWGAVCVLGQTCPSFWHEGVLSDSDWATDQDHSLLSPLLPPQSSPTHDMCHCHRSAPEDMTSWRSGQIPKAEKRGEEKKKKKAS